jgi:hypothetical protein
MKKKIIYVTDPQTNLTKRVIKHGGSRPGAGAKKKKKSEKKEPTKVIRVPVSLVSHVKALIKK